MKKLYHDNLLRSYQQEHAGKIYDVLINNKGALDGSDTGTGKTYVALSVAKKANMFPIVVTPRAVIPGWKSVAKLFRLDMFVSNYEQYKNGNTEYLSFTQTKRKRGNAVIQVKNFKWDVPENALIIFDEVHRCKDWNSQNAKMLKTAADQDLNILCLSATVGDNPVHFSAVGRAIRLFINDGKFWSWMYSRGVKKNPWGGFYFSNKARDLYLPRIHKEIYARGSRISIQDLGDKFPKNTVIADCYDMGTKSAKEINKLYSEMDSELVQLDDLVTHDKEHQLVANMRARQEIELLKVPTFIELAHDHVEEGMSVALFVNFTETIHALAKRLKINCIIDGSIIDDAREQNRKNFQSDRERIILCNIKAGGVGISLHDINGKYPRIGIISPTYSAIDLVQTLGRLPRDGARSKVIQKIVFCANTIEEQVAENVRRKIENIKLINQGDLL